MLFFFATRLWSRPHAGSDYDQDVAEFFTRANTPVDFDKEVGGDNTAVQARMLGIVACIYGGFITCLILIPNPWLGRAGILGCASLLWAVGGGLLLYARRQLKRDALTQALATTAST
jgi:hypothetical protein